MKPYRNKKYLKWVKTLACSVTHKQGSEPHHIIGHGVGGMGTKASDMFVFPLTRECHTELHHDFKEWERLYKSQWKHVGRTLFLAMMDGKLTGDQIGEEIMSQIKNEDDRKELGQWLR